MKRVYKWVIDGLEFSSLQKAKQFCRENKTEVQRVFMEPIGTEIM